MRAVSVAHGGEVFPGTVDEDGYRLAPLPGISPIEIIGEEGWEGLRRRAVFTVSIDDARLLSPISRPGKILCVGQNYSDHLAEQGADPPKRPILFSKAPTCVIGPNDPIPLHSITSQVDYEAELAIVIGQRATRVTSDDALTIVAGFTALNDVSARDLQFGDGQWVRGKSLDGFAPIGPHLVSVDELGDPESLDIICRVNGEVRQDSNTRHLIFGVRTLIEFCSEAITLEPGDVIATGTPGGVGVFMDPPQFLGEGDVVEVEIERIGTLSNPVAPVAVG